MSFQKEFQLVPENYAQSAALADHVGEQMLGRLDWVTLNPDVIVDMGCGVGYCAQQLKEKYPQARVFAVDTAYPMLKYASQQAENIGWTCADVFTLPLADHSVDLIFANLVLPWCDDVEKIFREWRRVLRPEGLLMFTSLGPDTLKAWRELLADKTLPHLVDMHIYGDALTKTRFADPVLDVDYFTLSYREAGKLFFELQTTGMILPGDYPDVIAHMQNAPEWQAAYEVIFGHAWGPAVSVDHVADEFGEVRIPLAHLRRRR